MPVAELKTLKQCLIAHTARDGKDDRQQRGCELSSSCRKYVFEVEDDYLVHFLGLWTICLGDAQNEAHVIAIDNEQTQGQPVTIASLQPSLLPMVNVHGLEITPPVTFLLTSGSGPVYISGQHVTLEANLNLSQEGHLSFI
ncbi:nucleoplasmin-like [Rhinoderma darwinii]|uniref:nucleoplasmin-like n=1 Tax=Rhinoderma darwinii TaxID=43563 RepID=UPI003F67402E